MPDELAPAAAGLLTFPNGQTDYPFPGWLGPLSLARSPDGHSLYAGAGPGGGPLVTRYARGADGRWSRAAGPVVAFDDPRYRFGVALAAGVEAVYATVSAGGAPLLVTLDRLTLANRGQRFVGDPNSRQGSAVAVWSPPPPPPVPFPLPLPPPAQSGRNITYGSSPSDKLWVRFDFEDESITADDRHWILRTFAKWTAAAGIPLRASTERPPASSRLRVGQYGTVRVVPQSQWTFVGGGQVNDLGCWFRGSVDVEHVAWCVGYPLPNRGREWVLWRALHEGVYHALAAQHDLHGGVNGAKGPPGRLGSVPQFPRWDQNVEMTAEELRMAKNCYAAWMSR